VVSISRTWSTWIELFARTQRLGWSVKSAWGRPNPGATNYAVGAARAYDDGVNIDLSTQVEAFLNDSGGVVPSDALNVHRDGRQRRPRCARRVRERGNCGIIIQEGLTSIAGSVNVLSRGRQTISDLDCSERLATPAIRQLDVLIPGASTFALQLTQASTSG
jgi:hypothetical protein